MTHYISQLILLSTGMPGEEKIMRMEKTKAEKERVKAEVAELKAKRAEAKDNIAEAQRGRKEAYKRKNERGEAYPDFLFAERCDIELTKYMKQFEDLTKQIETLMPKPVISEEEQALMNERAAIHKRLKPLEAAGDLHAMSLKISLRENIDELNEQLKEIRKRNKMG